MNSDVYINTLVNNFISWVQDCPNATLQQDGTSYLIRVAKEEWQNINIEIFHNLISNLSNCIKAIIKAKGEHTKY
ncbi:7018_t:CDS:2 [Diversispora eburnea]|uniref:7018_t:CDS:1 n=1 Tax=Diversispora eburnea TaxID=1213867 RepID=A0A9N9C3Y9_9GLOM|nr:7018_t:CDS:2 [Diversispora eburnea]